MTSQYKRALVIQYLRYTFTAGTLLVIGSLFNGVLIAVCGLWLAQKYNIAKCVAGIFLVLVFLHMLISLLRFIAYKKFNRDGLSK